MKAETIYLYKFDELSDKAKQTAIDNNRNFNVDYIDWYDSVFYDAKEIGKLMGIDIDDIFFSGFSSQGDGACFTGSYSYRKGSCLAVREYAPKDEKLRSIVDNLAQIQRSHFYQLSATVEHTDRYCHEYSTTISVYDCDEYADIETDEAICEVLRDFMRWIYKQLEADYWYLTTDESVKESLITNEYDFTESGEIYQ